MYIGLPPLISLKNGDHILLGTGIQIHFGSTGIQIHFGSVHAQNFQNCLDMFKIFSKQSPKMDSGI